MPPADRSPASYFRSDIEGLRGIAVLLVVACHCGISWCAGGFVGVDVFFVLSGYLITGLLVQELRKTSTLDLARFYARRARRLLPAATLTLLCTLAAAALIAAPQEVVFASRAARAAAAYMSNLFFDRNAADYFAPDVESNPFLHTWSLGIEEQFYLFWPALVLLGLGFARSTKALLAMLAALTLGSLAACVLATAAAPTFAFYELPARAWEFGVGGLFALKPAGAPRLPPRVWIGLGWLGLAAVLACGYLLSGGPGFPGWAALVPVLGTATALAAGAELPHRGIGALLDSKPLQYVGARSYSWYLWHWPFLVFAVCLLPGISLAGKVAVATGSLLAAALTFAAVERPVRQNGYLIARPVLSLALAGVATVASFGIATLALRFGDRLANEPAVQAVTVAVADIADMPRDRCVSLGRSEAVASCAFGDTSSAVTVALFGDSHAIQWFNPLQAVAKGAGWRLVTFVKSGCAATEIAGRNGAGLTDLCRTWRTAAIRRILELRPAVVFVATFTSYLGRQPADERAASLDGLTRAMAHTFRQFTGEGLRVVAIRDSPAAPFDVPTCLARSALHAWYAAASCDFARAPALDPAVFAAEQAGARGLRGVEFLDLTDSICRGADCPAIRDGRVVYRDDSHLAGAFTTSLAPAMDATLRTLLPALR